MTTIWVTTRFSALHYWPKAPIEVSFLQHPHRHEFHVKVEAEVFHDDRELEFFIVKNWLNNVVSIWSNTGSYTMSCEQFATEILFQFSIRFPREKSILGRRTLVTVSEDGENGATVTNYEVS